MKYTDEQIKAFGLIRESIPAHVAIIMDGNGRWAKKRGLPRTMGHKEGCSAIERLLPEASDLGIRYLTV